MSEELYLIDNIIYRGTSFDCEKAVFYASLHAAIVLNVECEILYTPAVCYPIDRSEDILYRFNLEFAYAYRILQLNLG